MKVDYKVFVFIGLGLLFLGLAVNATFFAPKKCYDVACFKSAMEQCSHANYVSDVVEATWRYDILGVTNGDCAIDVTMLQAKQGDSNIQKLQGLDMECDYPRGTFSYPERDLTKCHGRLKEELQTLAINKLHTYIVDNLGEIKKVLANSTT